jgi:hypothetical protein
MSLTSAGGKDDGGDPWDDPEVRGSWHGSVIVGDFFEELTSHLFGVNGANRYVNDSNADLCPDHIEANGEFFIECKATGPRGRHFFLHERAIDNYMQLTEAYEPVHRGLDPNPAMLFVFWVHGIKEKVGDFEYQSELQYALAQHVNECYVLDFAVVLAILAQCRLEDGAQWRGDFRRIRPHQLRGLREGWKEWLLRWFDSTDGYAPRTGALRNVQVYNHVVPSFPIHALLPKHLYGKKSLRKFWRLLHGSR